MTRFKYHQRVTVEKVWEHKFQTWVSGTGADAVFREESGGWFIKLAGSNEGFAVGNERPDINVGDLVDLSVRKAKGT